MLALHWLQLAVVLTHLLDEGLLQGQHLVQLHQLLGHLGLTQGVVRCEPPRHVLLSEGRIGLIKDRLLFTVSEV